MGRITNYSNTQKYSDKKSFDGKPVEEGKVLVPFKKEDMNLMPGEYIYDNFTTFHLGEFKIVVGFMAISEGYFASYMQEFWDKLNKELEAGREGRCVIVKNADGTDKLCPYTRKCKGCQNKGLLERRNTHRVEIISLDYEYEGDGFDIEDTSTPSVEDQVLEKIDPEPTEDELKLQMLAHFDKTNPRYGQIIRLSLSGMSIDDICALPSALSQVVADRKSITHMMPFVITSSFVITRKTVSSTKRAVTLYLCYRSRF